jgi:hypothetical protein
LSLLDCSLGVAWQFFTGSQIHFVRLVISRMRKIERSIHEGAREVARSITKTPENKWSRRERKKVEMLFAHPKRIMKLDRLRLRELSGA